MKFLITCDNCDYQFLTTGESRQTVQCQCPHCGGQMKVKLPDAPAPPSAPNKTAKDQTALPATKRQPASQPTRPVGGPLPEKPRRRTGCGIMVGLFLGLFILVLVAMVVYSLTRTEQTRPIEDPFEHVYDDSTRYDDSFEPLQEEAPDTIERHLEERDEAAPADSAATSEAPSEASENTEHSESPDNSETSEQSDKQEKAPNTSEQPTN